MNKKILFWDIEVFPAVYYGWSKFNPPFSQIEKTSINTICYKWAHEKKVETIQLTKKQHAKDPRNELPLIKQMLKVINEADIVIAHNGDRFDWKKFNARVLKYGLKPARKPKLIDTLKMVKREAAFDSHRLGDLCTELGIKTKVETEKNLFIKALHSWKHYEALADYCRHDVLALEALYDRLRPHCKPTVNAAGLANKLKACASCGSDHLIKYGTYILNNGTEVQRYRCGDCGSTKTRDSANGSKTLTAI